MIWYLSAAGLLYLSGLIVALVVGSDTVKVAVIAVGGTAVGAFAGLVGSITGARTQAAASQSAATLQAEASLKIKQSEFDAARKQLLLEEQLRWTGKAYDELTALLNTSRELGTMVGTYDNWGDVVVKLQQVATHASLLQGNPIIGGDPDLNERVSQYISTFSTWCRSDWLEAHGEKPILTESRGDPPGILGDVLAKRVGQRIREIGAQALQSDHTFE